MTSSVPTVDTLRYNGCEYVFEYLPNGSPTNIDEYMNAEFCIFLVFVGIKTGLFTRWCVNNP
jgi:hypothetical protein